MRYLPFQSEYTVSAPSVTISNTDLNIMYREYDNRFSISVPGISSNRLKVEVSNGASVKQDGEYWIIKPNAQAKNITVKVLADMEGATHVMGERTYRVKTLPSPSAYLKSGENEYNSNISRNALLDPNATLIASYGKDGLLDLPFTITSFKVRINGIYSETKGNKFTKDQRDKLGKLQRGSDIIIADIRARGAGGQEMTLSTIIFTLN